MEKAIHLANLKNLHYFNEDKYQRIYWGQEFCQNLIPSLSDTGKILTFICQNKLKISLVTPFVTECGLKKLKEMFSWLKSRKAKDVEIVVNDWGVLDCLSTQFKGQFEITLGRLLVRQQRDPAIRKVLEKQLPFAVRGKDGKINIIVHRPPQEKYQKGIKTSYVSSPIFQSFLSKFGVGRIELNNLVQGLDLEGIKFKKSLYTPYVNISTTRFCPMETKLQKIRRINTCTKECQKYYDILRSRAVPKIIYKRGNTTFYKNPINAKLLEEYGIDRVVFQPELPF